jgi:hypothetical protein
MSKTSPVMLNDTLNLIQLARETARLQGKQGQAETLKPVVDGLRSLVGGSAPGSPATPTAKSASPLSGSAAPARLESRGGVEMAQADFRVLLEAAARPPAAPASALPGLSQPALTPAFRLQTSPTTATLDRHGIIAAMASGGMTDLDIARQMGMTREEVRIIMQLENARR